MPQRRAFTWLSPGEVRVGNAWLELRCSAFFGQTTALLSGTPRREWLQKPAREFELVLNEFGMHLHDFGEIAFNESCDNYAATLEMHLSNPGWSICLETAAFHEHPGMIRRWWLRNRGSQAATLDHARVEVRSFCSAPWNSGRFLGLEHAGQGLLLVSRGESCWCPVGQAEWALELQAPAEVAPGARTPLAETALLAFDNGREQAQTTDWPRFEAFLQRQAEEAALCARLRAREAQRERGPGESER